MYLFKKKKVKNKYVLRMSRVLFYDLKSVLILGK